MKILAIESSCDETAAAVVEDGQKILSNVVVSQIDIFAEYGGVIPEVAARSHLEAILPVVHRALSDAGIGKDEIDAIAVTHAPGLLGSLLIGTLTARVLAILWQKPLYAVHHLKSHIYANWLGKASDQALFFSEPASTRPVVTGESRFGRSPLVAKSSEEEQISVPAFPLLALVVSGGHTQIIYMREHNQFEIIGTTRDDAVGECFDKVAKILGLAYPGGPAIARAAERGDPGRYKLPHPKVGGLDFSFSGLKTAVLRAVQAECGLPISTPSYELRNHLSEQQVADFAASFQATAAEILVEQLKKALEGHPEVKSLVFAGGVSANQVLRQKALDELSEASPGIFVSADEQKSTKKMVDGDALQGDESQAVLRRPIYFPEVQYTGDNAAMVGVAAYYEIQSGVEPTDPYSLSIAPRVEIQ